VATSWSRPCTQDPSPTPSPLPSSSRRSGWTPRRRAVLAERLVAAIHQTLTERGSRVTLLEPKRGQPNDEITPVLADGDLGALDKHSITFEPLQARVPLGR
jgi:hypothetical protein